MSSPGSINVILPSKASSTHLRSGSRNRLLYAPKPKQELTWKYANLESFNQLYKKPKLAPGNFSIPHKRTSDGSDDIKPVIVSDSGKAISGLMLSKDASPSYTVAPTASVSIKNARDKRHSFAGTRELKQTLSSYVPIAPRHSSFSGEQPKDLFSYFRSSSVPNDVVDQDHTPEDDDGSTTTDESTVVSSDKVHPIENLEL